MILFAAFQQYLLSDFAERIRQAGLYVDFHADERRWVTPAEMTKYDAELWLKRLEPCLERLHGMVSLGVFSAKALSIQRDMYGPLNVDRKRRKDLSEDDAHEIQSKAMAIGPTGVVLLETELCRLTQTFRSLGFLLVNSSASERACMPIKASDPCNIGVIGLTLGQSTFTKGSRGRFAHRSTGTDSPVGELVGVIGSTFLPSVEGPTVKWKSRRGSNAGTGDGQSQRLPVRISLRTNELNDDSFSISDVNETGSR